MTILRKKMHPVHVILVHFPSALYPFALVMEVLAYYFKEVSYSESAFYALCGGFIFSILAIVFGAIDFYRLDSNHSGWKTASYHAILNIIWFFGFTVLLKSRYNLFVENSMPEIGFIVSFMLMNAGMAFSNYLGGELVFKHKVGVER